MKKLYVRPVRARTTCDMSTIGWEVLASNLERVSLAPFKSQAIEQALDVVPDGKIVDEEVTGTEIVDRDRIPIMGLEVIGVGLSCRELILKLPTGKHIIVNVQREFLEETRSAVKEAWERG